VQQSLFNSDKTVSSDGDQTSLLAEQVLKNVFGFSTFRGPQKNIIEHIINGNDALVLMPTGGGKSLCYQVPGLVRSGVAIIISPLISLMQDQVQSLNELGVAAHAYNSTLTMKQKRIVEQDLLAGDVKFLYMSPERLSLDYTTRLLDKLEIALFAIDEAHCVSKWGHDFRPEYRKLSNIHKRFKDIPRIALTATADKFTRADIVKELSLKKSKVFLGSFDRPNISYGSEKKLRRGTAQLTDFLEDHRGESGIIYCLSRRKVEEFTIFLREKGYNAYAYHAGLPVKERTSSQETFIYDESVIMVATLAFGMGIDKPDVRFVVHMDLPKNIENYYQETGRAGRDGLPAKAMLFYGLQDVVTLKKMIQKGRKGTQRANFEVSSLEGMLSFAESKACLRQIILQNFDEDFRGPCGNCSSCYDLEENTLVKYFDAREWVTTLLTLYYKIDSPLGLFELCDMARGLVTRQARENGWLEIDGFAFAIKENERGVLFGIRQCIAYGLLKQDFDNNGVLVMTNLAASFLGDKSIFYFRENPKNYAKQSQTKTSKRASAKRAQTRKKRVRKKKPSYMSEQGIVATGLLAHLKEVRRAESKKRKLPAYKVFHDKTLMEMAELKPRDKDDFLELSGVGEVKAKKYAKIFIDAMIEYDNYY
jgi:ATP-dependent DNA helicase RecQ